MLALLLAPSATAQLIDFEVLPDGTPTVDQQEISTQWSAPPFGVTFEVVDRNTLQFLAFPRLAKVGAPRTAFQGCNGGSDNVVPNAGVCETFLTDDGMVGSIGSLRVSYSAPVAGASGSLLDVDRPSGDEQWTVTGFDGFGAVVDVTIVDPLNSTPCGQSEGNGTAVNWTLASPTGQREIQTILFEYTGTHPLNLVGVAFDNFSPTASGLGNEVVGCDPADNSSGGPALTFASGSSFATANQLRLRTQGLPTSTFGYYLTSRVVGGPIMPPNSDGFLCLGGSIGRFNAPTQIQSSGSCGLFFLDVDLSSVPTPTGLVSVLAGETWVYQAWYRDANPITTSNFSSSVEIAFQ